MYIKRISTLLLVGGILTCSAAEVGKVTFEQSGATKLQESMLKAYTRLASGVEFSRDKLDADIKTPQYRTLC